MKKIFTFLIAILLPIGAIGADVPDLDILSDGDASLYEQIFLLQDAEEISAAQKLQEQLNDPYPTPIAPVAKNWWHGWINTMTCRAPNAW